MSEAERSVFDILCDVGSNFQGIVRSEFRLATTELRADISASQSSVRLLGIGLLSAIFAAFFALLALVYALSYVLLAWAAALLIAFALAVCAAVLVTVGSRRLKRLTCARKLAGQSPQRRA
jgi:uncharacterized membrane protein YqjE